jgi:hypothetical protein
MTAQRTKPPADNSVLDRNTHPLVLAEWTGRREGEFVRLQIEDDHGWPRLYMRVLRVEEDEVLRPTKRAVAIPPHMLPELCAALVEAKKELIIRFRQLGQPKE